MSAERLQQSSDARTQSTDTIQSGGGEDMLGWAVIFLIIALVAAVSGFGGIAAASAGIAKLLFVIFCAVRDLFDFRVARQTRSLSYNDSFSSICDSRLASRRSLVLGLLSHSVQKFVSILAYNFCVPRSRIRANPCSSVARYRRVIRPAYCVMRFASPHFGERMKVRGHSFWLSQVAIRLVIWFEWIESLESKPSTVVFSAKTSRT